MCLEIELRLLSTAACDTQFLCKLSELQIIEAPCPGRAALDTATAKNTSFSIGCNKVFNESDSCRRAGFFTFLTSYADRIIGLRRNIPGWPPLSVRKIARDIKG